MDFQGFVDCCATACAVLSVERNDDGSCGTIRIVCANDVYKQAMGPGYYDGMVYDELVPKDIKFEDFCFRAAHLGQRMHAYVETKALDCWTDQAMVPLVRKNDRLGYCQFLFEFTKQADPSRMASVSIENAEAIIKASVTLLGASEFLAGVSQVMEDTRAICDAACCRIMLVDDERHSAEVFCECLRGDIDIARDYADAGDGVISYETVKSWERLMGVSNAIIMKDAHDLADIERRNAVWAAELRAYHVRSLVIIPLRGLGSIVGWLYVTDFDTDKVVQIKELLELLSFILGPELANHILVSRLEQMSMTDVLTGLGNRTAMDLRRTELRQLEQDGLPHCFGVVELDLNGLKTVNDEQGHLAGDALLVAAGRVLQEAFRRSDLFRAGGDEFVVVVRDMSQEAFAERVERLRQGSAEHPEVSFALGACWSDGSIDMRQAFREADRLMYEDKRAYYLAHPERRKR